MRKVLLLILLASTASPALAEPDNDGTPSRARQRAEHAQSDIDSQRQERPVERPQGNSEPAGNPGQSDAGKPARVEGRSHRDADAPRIERVAPVEHVVPAERRAAGGDARSSRRDSDASGETHEREVERRPSTLPGRPAIVVQDDPNDALAAGGAETNRRGRGRDGEGVGASIEERNLRTAPNVREAGGLVQPRRPVPRVMDPERRVSRTPILGTEPPAPRTAADRRAEPSTRWNSGWRHDRRYDWRDWRRRHRNRFHLSFYSDPFGWDYFRYGIGWRLWPSYYRSNYWLHDPWEYRLPPAYGPYRWIRYHDDALLVNIYTGQVVDVIYDFFW